MPKKGPRVSWSDGRLLFDYDNPPMRGKVPLTYRKLEDPDREDGYVQYYLGWVKPRYSLYKKVYFNPYEHFREVVDMKRRNQESQKKAGKWSPSGDPFLDRFPNIDKELTDAFWEDGKPRDVCSLTLRAGKGTASVYINDPEQGAGINTNGTSIEDALTRLDAYLGTENPTWRPHSNKKR